MQTHRASSYYCRLILMLLVGSTMHLLAAPYGREGKVTEFNQPGVGKLTLRVFGDEFYGRTETMDGYTVVYDASAKAYCYANLTPNGQDLISTAAVVGKINPATLGLTKKLKQPTEVVRAIAKARYDKWDKETHLSERWQKQKAVVRMFEEAKAKAALQNSIQPEPPTITTVGDKQGLTLLVDFDDAPSSVPQAEIVSYLNADNYTSNGNNGSVKKYFQDNSKGLLNYTNVVTAYVRIPNSVHPKSYYNNPGKDCGESGNELIRDALNILKALPNYTTEILPTFANLTVDGGNQIVATNVFYAGDNGGVWSRGLWPHSWQLFVVGPQDLGNGKVVNKYQITDIGNNLEIATFCHENGHMLCGYPDIYDYDYDSTGGAGLFCLMNNGAQTGNPTLICAYLRRASGWTNTIDVNSTSSVIAELAADLSSDGFNTIYRYPKPGTDTEYFLFENRQQSRRDTLIPSSGIAVWHIDELGDRDNQSIVPNSVHANYECTLVQADNLWDFENNRNAGDVNDLYYLGNSAGTYTNTLNATSAPNANWWDGSPSGMKASNFSASRDNMTIQFGDPAPEIAIDLADGTNLVDGISTVSFGDLSSGASSVRTFTIRNIGAATLTNLAITKTGTHAGDYSVTALGVTSLAPGDSAKFSVTFIPSAVGVRTASLQIASNDSDENPFDVALSGEVPLTLAQALDLTRFIWTSDGDLTWVPQTMTNHDGADAAQSGAIAHSQSTSFQTTLTEAGTLTFWWKVSSEINKDSLAFFIDGVEQTGSLAKISGSVNWVQKSATIPAGSHVVKWTYRKDSSLSSGQDKGWVDQVVFIPAAQPEIAVEQPANVDLIDGSATIAYGTIPYGSSSVKTFTIRNVGVNNLIGLTISKNGTNNAEFTVGTLAVTTLAPGASTTFDVSFRPTLAGTRTAALQIFSSDLNESPFDINLTGVGADISLADAVDAPAMVWASTASPGTAVWTPQSLTTQDGVDAAQSGFIGNNQSSSIETSTNEAGTLTFWWKISSEADYDFLTFYIDDVEQLGDLAKISGEVDWVKKTVTIPAGAHTLKWVYQKDANDPLGMTKGTAWLDQVVFDTNPLPDIVVEQPVGTELVDAAGGVSLGEVALGTYATRTFTIRNNGNANLSGLAISKTGINNTDFVVGAPGATALAPGASTTFDVTFNPTALGSRVAALHLASNDPNENPFDINLSGTCLMTLTEALDSTGVAWFTAGDAIWTPQTVVTQDGVDAAKSGEITNLQSSSVQMITSLPGILTFWWKVSSEANADTLAFFIDDVEQAGPLARISGEVDWVQKSVIIPTGTHTLRWTYSKDASVKSGSDAAWLDQVVYYAEPEIVVEQAGTDLVDGTATIDFGSADVGSTTTVKSFTVKNTGNGDLKNMVITKAGANIDDFELSAMGSTTLAAGGSTTFTVTFSPTMAGHREAAFFVASNDEDERLFKVSLAGTGVALPGVPEIAVEQPAGTDLTDGNTKDFGAVNVGATTSLTYTIRNPGTADLTGLAVTKDGANAADLSINATGMVTTLTPGATTTFTVTFAPSVVGAHASALHIASNDANEASFDIGFVGTGVGAPEIAVEQPAGTNLTDGGAANLGAVNLGSTTSLTYTIRNAGSANLTGLAVTKDGANAADLSINTTGMLATLTPGATTTFTVTFAPSVVGAHASALHIASNDTDENPFDLVLSGTGVGLPEIAVQQLAGTHLLDGETRNFGTVNYGAATSATYIVRNVGTANLTGLAVNKDGINAGEFSINTTGMPATLAPGATASFTVTFTPGRLGAHVAALHITNNDADENPFDINLAGTGDSTDPFIISFVGNPFEPRIGDPIMLDLKRLLPPNSGLTLKLVGKLPTGLRFDPATGLVTGIINGKPGTYQVSVRFMSGNTIVDSRSLSITVLPFPATLAGGFDCLLEDADSMPVGAFRLTTTTASQWTATLNTVGTASRRSAKGSIILDPGMPTASITAAFAATSGAPAMTIHLNLDANSPIVTGNYNGGTLRGFRLASGVTNPPATTTCSLALDAGEQDGITVPAGIGWMKGKISKTGVGTFSGMLGDGTAAAFTLRFSASGQAVLWVQPYSNKNSFVGGIVTLTNLGQPSSDNPLLSGNVSWVKMADFNTLSYPSGFGPVPVIVKASRWSAPPTASALGASLGWRGDRMAAITIDGAGLNNADPQSTSVALLTEFTLDDKFALLATAPAGSRVPWTGKVVKTNGSISGSLTFPAGFSGTIPSGAAPVSGLLFQDESWGSVTGCGLIKVPTNGAKGSFRTASFILGQ